jgi:hypothetical protein
LGTGTAEEALSTPSWNTSGRPKEAKKGTFGFNTETKKLEFWNGTYWLKLPMKKIS